MFEDQDYLNKIKSIDKSYMKTEKYSLSKQNPLLSEYKKYYGKVHRLTEQTYNEFKNEINPNSYVRGKAGTPNAYHLDHKISVKYGFLNGIDPVEISKKENLQLLPWRENIIKGWKEK